MGQLEISVLAKREGKFGFEGHQKFQYGITWEMGVEFNAPQRRVVGKGVGFKIWRLARLG